MKQLVKYSLWVFIPLVISCSTSGQKETTDDYLNGLIKDKKIAGMAVAVLKGNDIILTKNNGFADVGEQKMVTDSTQFGIMSITKNIIAFAVMQLSEKRQIDLNTSTRKYLDKLPPAYDKVLVHQLLNHTAGVPDYVEVPGYLAQANKTQTPWEVLTTILDKPLAFNPGEKSVYSNSGYFLLGMLIEKVSGRSLGEYLTENIFTPVGMGHTFFDDGSIASSNTRAKGYEIVNNQLKEVAPLNPSQYWAAGAIVTTLADMIKWNQAVKKGTILPASVINQMMQPAKLNDGTNSECGLGFELMNTSDMKMAGNNGAGIGINAANLQFINDGLTVIVLTNTSNSNSTLIAKKHSRFGGGRPKRRCHCHHSKNKRQT